jgi:hypothetical protein
MYVYCYIVPGKVDVSVAVCGKASWRTTLLARSKYWESEDSEFGFNDLKKGHLIGRLRILSEMGFRIPEGLMIELTESGSEPVSDGCMALMRQQMGFLVPTETSSGWLDGPDEAPPRVEGTTTYPIQKSPPAPKLGYSTHILLGYCPEGHAMLASWDHLPTREELSKAKEKALATGWKQLALANVVGVL